MINALMITRRSLYAALSPLVPVFAGRPACYWRKADDALGLVAALVAQPALLTGAIVFQSQDAGGASLPIFGGQDWTGQITIRCLTGSLSSAETLLLTVPAALATLAVPTGYRIRAEFVRPLDLPTLDGVATAAAIYQVTLIKE